MDPVYHLPPLRHKKRFIFLSEQYIYGGPSPVS